MHSLLADSGSGACAAPTLHSVSRSLECLASMASPPGLVGPSRPSGSSGCLSPWPGGWPGASFGRHSVTGGSSRGLP
eukprot:825666-Prorocentrum_minimum.AAC.7